MERLHKQTLLEGLFFLILGVVILLLIPTQIRMAPTVQTVVTPKFLPTLLGVLLIVVGALMLVQAFKGKVDTPNAEFSVFGMKRVLITTLLLIAYIELFQIIGIVVTSSIFIVVFSYMFGLRDVKKYILSAVGAPLVVWLVFEYIFKIPLPHGFIW